MEPKLVLQIRRFLQGNVIHHKTITVNQTKARYLEKQRKDDIPKLMASRKDDFVDIKIDIYGRRISISGNKDGLRYAEERIKHMLDSLVTKDYEVKRPGQLKRKILSIFNYLFTPRRHILHNTLLE